MKTVTIHAKSVKGRKRPTVHITSETEFNIIADFGAGK
jgi:hypothetical protein